MPKKLILAAAAIWVIFALITGPGGGGELFRYQDEVQSVCAVGLAIFWVLYLVYRKHSDRD